jgi:hypothetical protein
VIDQVLHPYKRRNRPLVLCVLIFPFSDRHDRTERWQALPKFNLIFIPYASGFDLLASFVLIFGIFVICSGLFKGRHTVILSCIVCTRCERVFNFLRQTCVFYATKFIIIIIIIINVNS